jgi:hypothetical protein
VRSASRLVQGPLPPMLRDPHPRKHSPITVSVTVLLLDFLVEPGVPSAA